MTNLYQFCEDYLRDLVDSDGTAQDVSDAVIRREAQKLETLLFQTASSFADNDFDRNA